MTNYERLVPSGNDGNMYRQDPGDSYLREVCNRSRNDQMSMVPDCAAVLDSKAADFLARYSQTGLTTIGSLFTDDDHAVQARVTVEAISPDVPYTFAQLVVTDIHGKDYAVLNVAKQSDTGSSAPRMIYGFGSNGNITLDPKFVSECVEQVGKQWRNKGGIYDSSTESMLERFPGYVDYKLATRLNVAGTRLLDEQDARIVPGYLGGMPELNWLVSSVKTRDDDDGLIYRGRTKMVVANVICSGQPTSSMFLTYNNFVTPAPREGAWSIETFSRGQGYHFGGVWYPNRLIKAAEIMAGIDENDIDDPKGPGTPPEPLPITS